MAHAVVDACGLDGANAGLPRMEATAGTVPDIIGPRTDAGTVASPVTMGASSVTSYSLFVDSKMHSKRAALLSTWYFSHALLAGLAVTAFIANEYILNARPFDSAWNQESSYYHDTISAVSMKHALIPIYLVLLWMVANMSVVFVYGRWILKENRTKPHLAVILSAVIVLSLICLLLALWFTIFELRFSFEWSSGNAMTELTYERWGAESKNLRSTNRIFGVFCFSASCMYIGLVLNGYMYMDPTLFRNKIFPIIFFGRNPPSFFKQSLLFNAYLGFLAASVLLSTTVEVARGFGFAKKEVRVAFMGNSMQYYNDCPRFMEALSGNTIVQQNSTLKPSGTFKSLAKKGNNMSVKFHTENALTKEGYYDIGALTIRSLLLDNGYGHWNYAVMNDRTYNPPDDTYRNASKLVLESTYAPLLEKAGAIPILISTYSPRRNKRRGNITVPEYTEMIADGVQEYAEVLTNALPEWQYAKVAPVGQAFLAVYEDNYDFWEKLFFTDLLHPSPHGTYLQGCVIYCTIFGEPPPKSSALQKNISKLWSKARYTQKVEDQSLQMAFPTRYTQKVEDQS
eukprot:CAMPEP_0194313266 /NCGR_PEP_ID=MMETSP0171-20130528/10152_1 /TAXON_ID=218684 /ORGANISM="Corethron pennatum, Strain L29A3" /LENGTH=568 /DNA_ID=CAMNT_0039068143 /DNA_START=202 /DNA_END=1905 /DNA_ORIENTATION=-